MIHQLYDDLRDFAEYAAGHADEKYFSLYLLTDPSYIENQSQTPAWQVYLKNAVNEVEAGLDPTQTKQWKSVRLSDNDPNKEWARIRKRLDKYLTSYRPEGKTLALFISPGSEHSFELPVRLTNRHSFGKPRVQDFLWALDEYQQHVVILLAEDEARVLRLALGSTGREGVVIADDARLRQFRTSGEHANIQTRRNELDRRFIRQAAADVDKYFLKNPDTERIILGGNMEMANAVLGSLHKAVQEKVIAVMPIPITAAPHEVAAHISEAAEVAEREYETALVDEVTAQAKARGRGAIGSVAVGRALDRGAVRLLALPYPGDADTVEPLLLQAIRAGSHVEFLHGEAAERAAAAGGIVAQLYYSLS